MFNIWRHKKTGGLYIILDEDAIIEKTLERATIYRSLSDNRTWIRPFEEFHDGRFEVLNSAEYKEGSVVLKHNDSF